MYNVSLEKFEGPFDLLLDLIDKKKLSINEVSLAQVSDQYLNYLKQIKNFPLKEVTGFLVIASTLMFIKSRSLMPSLKLSGDEETEIKNLEEQLKIYKEIKQLTKELEKIFCRKIIFNREAFLNTKPVFIEPKGVTAFKLKEVLQKMITESIKFKEILPQAIIKKAITIEQKINELVKKLESKIAVCFSEFGNPKDCDKIDLIVSFLALLELTKQGLITVKQNYVFGEIKISKPH